MNKRIKELMPKPWTFPYPDRELYTKEQMEKFAELVVRECITQINEAIPDTDCSVSGAYKTAKIAAMTRVKDHFGVA
jgi:hypothetical protein